MMCFSCLNAKLDQVVGFCFYFILPILYFTLPSYICYEEVGFSLWGRGGTEVSNNIKLSVIENWYWFVLELKYGHCNYFYINIALRTFL